MAFEGLFTKTTYCCMLTCLTLPISDTCPNQFIYKTCTVNANNENYLMQTWLSMLMQSWRMINEDAPPTRIYINNISLIMTTNLWAYVAFLVFLHSAVGSPVVKWGTKKVLDISGESRQWISEDLYVQIRQLMDNVCMKTYQQLSRDHSWIDFRCSCMITLGPFRSSDWRILMVFIIKNYIG